MITDACVPLTRLPELIRRTREELDKSWLPAPLIAHAGLIVVEYNIEYRTLLSESLGEDIIIATLLTILALLWHSQQWFQQHN
jgi:FAD/FMN-containing dehydrogenase